MFTSLGDDFWDGITDAQKDRTIGAKHVDGSPVQTMRMVSVQPKTFVVALETVEPVSVGRATYNESISAFLKLADQFTEEFRIQEIGRAGLRTWHLTGGNEPEGRSLEKLLTCLDPQLTESISRFGAIKDAGFSFDGAADERFKYHFRCGPVMKDELKTKDHFSEIRDAISESSRASRMYDIDLYEENFSLKGRNVSSWMKSQLERSFEMMASADRPIWG